MGVGVKCDGVDLRHINFPIPHNALICSDIDHLADNAASVFIVLILDEPALQADRKLVDESVMGDGKIDMSKVNAIAFDPYTHGYYKVTERVGEAFRDGLKLKK